ncbi:ATPases of the AAA+ class [Paramagnetospirillum magnetotacticum MS-1]|uniref:ATPases of the AAA+ class n=2 Tax=Paramagnetospirillum magnetotacticum TaxID=188 RepID=A0A0C2U5L1_PARME|nr:ATPases of the AAA+ class [Paramagnetospirillum magnetotacticum MS-1]
MTPTYQAFDNNLKLLCAYFGLEDIERKILELSCYYRIFPMMKNLWDDINAMNSRGDNHLISLLLGITPIELEKWLSGNASLLRLGLLSNRMQFSAFSFSAVVADGLIEALMPPAITVEDFCSRLIGPATVPTCEWSDFDHLVAERDMAFRLLKGAIGRGVKGINVLVYGPPGTGKTEFCKVLGAKLGVRTYTVGEADGEGGEPDRSARLARLRLSQNLLGANCENLMLFDEMEDLLGGAGPGYHSLYRHRERRDYSKVYLNRLLEETPIPTLWTCNEVDGFDPSVLRRMTLAIEIRTPPQKVRERLWSATLKRHDLEIGPDKVRTLASQFSVPPAFAANAVRAAKLAGGSEDDLRLALRLSGKVMGGGMAPIPPQPHCDHEFALDLANADHPLDRLVQRLASIGPKRGVSLCLFGPPGTGKSAFARHLAMAMGLPVLQKRASDLFSKWVGQSEANIARAFAEAQELGAFLIFDEADSLLGERAGAQRSWEISQVNEMLTWMESHELPFACTTNLADRLDSASLRRFTFKIRFDPLTPEQIRTAFTVFFGIDAPAAVSRISPLTPGDFAVVRRKAELLDLLDDQGALLAALRSEAEGKPTYSKPIGFM